VVPRAFLVALLVFPCVSLDAKAARVRYFGVWSYAENAPREELSAEGVSAHRLGYWALEFDEEDRVIGGSYHAADGTVWLSLRYAEEGGRIYADLFGPTGEFLTRKSTTLSDRRPHWP
jgi:hypothetical protein